MRGLVMSVVMLAGLSAAGDVAAQQADAPPAAMVFFDFGKAEIQRDYLVALDVVAAEVVSQAGTSVIVEGHSDRPGSSAANRRAALHRAEAVRDHMIGKGVAAAAIVVNALGEDRPLIPTADGVREPQNRRVDVRMTAGPGR